MYGLDEKQILNVPLKWRNMDCRSYWCSHWYAQQCGFSFFFFFLSTHTRDLNFCFYNEPPTSINELINIFQTCSEECWRNLTPRFSCSQLPCGMNAVSNVILIRQLIQIIFCLKGSKEATVEKVHAIIEHLDRKDADFTHLCSCHVCQTKPILLKCHSGNHAQLCLVCNKMFVLSD